MNARTGWPRARGLWGVLCEASEGSISSSCLPAGPQTLPPENQSPERSVPGASFEVERPWRVALCTDTEPPAAVAGWQALRGGVQVLGAAVPGCRFQLHSLKQAFVLPLLFPHPVAAWQPRKLLTATGLPCVPCFRTKRMTSPRH